MTAKKTIAYIAMVVAILSFLSALGSSIGITFYVFTIFQESGNETSQSLLTGMRIRAQEGFNQIL